MKKYEDERINYLLEQLQEDIKLDGVDSYRNVNCELDELCKNIDKVENYVKNGYKGALYLKSNIWETYYYTLSQVLQLYNLRFVSSEISKYKRGIYIFPKSALQYERSK